MKNTLTVIISLGGNTSPTIGCGLFLLFGCVMLNEHAANPGAAIGNNDMKLFGGVDGVFIFLVGFFKPAANFGRPRFLCLMSIHVSHFPNAEHLLQGRDTLYNR